MIRLQLICNMKTSQLYRLAKVYMCRLNGFLGLTCFERVSEALLGEGDLQDNICCRLANSEQLLLNAEVVHLLREKADNRGASQRSLAGPELKAYLCKSKK